MHNDKESPYTLTLLDDDLSFQVVRFSGREALNQPYRFDIEVLGLAPAMSPEHLCNNRRTSVSGQVRAFMACCTASIANTTGRTA